jgi:hypothetical protein
MGLYGSGILGVPLVELDVEQFALPITTNVTSYFWVGRRQFAVSLVFSGAS